MKIAVIYIRVSTKKQANGKANSYEMQEQRCINYCKEKGYEIAKIYKDVESGGKDDRPEFLKLMNDIPKKIFDIVVFNEVSRIARKSSTGMKFFEELEMYNIPFYAVTQPFIENKLLLTLYIGMSTQEREQISQREKANFYERVKQGLKATGTAPLGYTVKDKKLYIVEDEAKLVQEIFDFFLETLSVSKTAKKYNKTRKSTRYLLENKTYIGYMPYGKWSKTLYGKIIESKGEYFPSTHEPIIDKETFDKVQHILKNNLTVYLPRFNTEKHKNKLLFNGLLRCPVCGSKMYRNPYLSKRTTTPYYIYYYRCYNENCHKFINSNKIENKIIEKLKTLHKINLIEQDKKNSKKDLKKIEKLQQSLDNYDEERKKIIKLFQKNLISEEEIEESFRNLDKEKINNENELKLLTSKVRAEISEEKISNLEKLKFVLENFKEEDVPEIRKFLKLIIEKIEIKSKKDGDFDFEIILY